MVISSGKRLTIETAADFSQRLREGLASPAHVVIAFDDEVELDITALQIFCSACKTAAAEGKSFSYRGERPNSLTSLLAACGAVGHGSCQHNNNSICICFGGEK
jgi:anti-anti-sigma regulatory factor